MFFQKDNLECKFSSLLIGVRVMARWKDGYYYPGEVVSQEMEGRSVDYFSDILVLFFQDNHSPGKSEKYL